MNKEYKLTRITKWSNFYKGRIIIITPRNENDQKFQTHTIDLIVQDGHDLEVIIDEEKNKYFSLFMYNQNKGWVKDIYVIDLIQSNTESKKIEEALEGIGKFVKREREYQNGDNFTMFNEAFIRDLTKLKSILEGGE